MPSEAILSAPETAVAAKPRRGAKAYLVASAWAQVCALLRYVLLARLLGPEQLGYAATLILTASFFDLISDIGGDRFLVQDKDGDEPRVQGLVQLALVVRGFSIAACMAIVAWPVAYFSKAPALGPAIAVFALSPLITGFLHLDLRRKQRHNDFRTESNCALISEAAGLVVTVIAALLTHNFTAVLWGLITRALVWVACSHWLATRPYSIAYSHQDGPRLARFSLPLMLNGLILFLGGQGDRVLVGGRVGFAGLGHYSAVILLVFYPSAVVQKYAHAIYMPMIAAARSAPVERARISGQLASQTVLLSLGMSVGFAMVAPFVVALLYGSRFSLSPLTVALIGILQASRFLTVWPTTVALAMGRSTIVLANNLLRLTAWPAALAGFVVSPNLVGVVAGFIFGELVAFAVALVMLNRSERTSLWGGVDRFALFLAASLTTVAWTFAVAHPTVLGVAALAAVSIALAGWIVRAEFVTLQETFLLARRVMLRR
jgi:O-antigen/teichoic acid export membrane protein